MIETSVDKLKEGFEKVQNFNQSRRRLMLIFLLIPAIFGFVWLYFSITSISEIAVQKEQIVEENVSISEDSQYIDTLEKENDRLRSLMAKLALTVDSLKFQIESQNDPEPMIVEIEEHIEELLEDTLSIVHVYQPDWGVLIKSYNDMKSALEDQKKFQELGKGRVWIYKRNDKFATCVKFDRRTEASKVLRKIKAEINKTAYIADMKNWCKNPIKKEDCTECESTEVHKEHMQQSLIDKTGILGH